MCVGVWVCKGIVLRIVAYHNPHRIILGSFSVDLWVTKPSARQLAGSVLNGKSWNNESAYNCRLKPRKSSMVLSSCSIKS